MKFHVNSPAYAKGEKLEVPGVGVVENGATLELTDVQVDAMKANGLDVPSDGDMYLYKEAPASTKAEPKTENLPSVAEVAEKERSKAERSSERKGK